MGADGCEVVAEGCPAVLIAESMKGERRSYYIRISAESTYSTIAGVIAARKILGKPWGVLLRSRLGAVAVVKPSIAELMEGFYERRTQVIYPKDSGLIAILAGARPEARLLEAGVGSGFLTTVLAMGLCPTGRLIGLDVKRENLEAARRNLESAGLLDCVDLKLGDVRDPAAVEGVGPLDGVVLDMPDPWSALESLGPEVKPSAVAVAFVPTSTQLEKLLDHLPGGWMLQGGVETMARTINLSPGAVRPGEWLASFTGYIVVLRRVVQG